MRVPASTSNLGPGFDCLGVALRLYNEITVTRDVRAQHAAMIRDVATTFFSKTNYKQFDFSCRISGEIPVARGLGSSATIRVGLLFALNKLARTNLTRDNIFTIAAELEKHPDNAAPAVFGGFTVVRGLHVQRFAVASRLLFVLLVPPIKIATARARAALPKNISLTAAVMSAGNAAAITAAFTSRHYENLRGTFRDGLHQPYREKFIPCLADCVAAAEQAGALGAFLSGSGSAICAITLGDPAKIASAMQSALGSDQAPTIITRADNSGARIIESR